MPFTNVAATFPQAAHRFRDNGTLLTEEVMGLEGSPATSRSSTTCSALRVKELGKFTPIERKEWVPTPTRTDC